MSNQQILVEGTTIKRSLPINLNPDDLGLFEKELTFTVPNTLLLTFNNLTVSPRGILFKGNKILAESFPDPSFFKKRAGIKAKVQIILINLLSPFLSDETIDQNVFWITDIWSQSYFHWLTDALPRLLTIREKIQNATLLLPYSYHQYQYITSSLQLFLIQDVKYIKNVTYCQNLQIPTHIALTGNYNEVIMQQLRELYVNYFHNTQSETAYRRVYVSRSKALKRKIVNEDECIVILKEYGFEIMNFEDYSFEEQVKIAQNIEYLISNHGAGLTNMLFMKSNSSVLELRKQDDAHNNCYFTLASALKLQYYYQLCPAEKPNQSTGQANLIVNCQMLRKNIEQMLKNAKNP